MAALDPEVDPDNIIALGERRAIGQTIQSAEDSPDDAARAMELSDATGVHPALVYGDLDNFEQQHKIQLGANIVRSNRFIQDYVNSHPLAAKVSNDDYGQLDKVSEAVIKHNSGSVLAQAIKGFTEGFGERGLGGSYFQAPKTLEEAQAAGAGGALAAGVALFGAIPETTFRVAGGVLTGLTRAAEQLHRSTTGGEPEWGDKFLRTISDPGLWASIGIADPLATLHGNLAHNAELRAEIARVSPYIESGRPIPVGVHELVDEAHVEQAKIDAKNLGDALKEAVKSSTRERSPELFASFLRNHPGADGDIGISADAVRALYGDKPPQPGDNLLGFVPDLADQLARAEATGGDIKVNKADYLAQVEPEVHKAIEDHIRSRPEGLTVEEGKGLPPIEAYHGSPHEFDAFDLSKIGTGEGAQSYGHGLYFAEAPEVAKSYKNARSIATTLSQRNANNYLSLAGYDKQKAIALAEEELKYATGNDKLNVEDALDVLKETQGNQYKVHIHANKEDFLDWDKPLSEQSPNVLSGIQKLEPGYRKLIETTFEDYPQQQRDKGPARGEALMRDLTENVGAKEASRILHEAGIPGIKYLDQGSRELGAKASVEDTAISVLDAVGGDRTKAVAELESRIKSAEGLPDEYKAKETNIYTARDLLKSDWKDPRTHNFVLFDPSLVEITHRNGDAVRSLRQAAGLQGIQERKLTLERTAESARAKAAGSTEAAHVFVMKDATGKDLGEIYIAEEKGGKRLYVDDVRSPEGPQSLGPRAMRDALEQIKEQFPNAETLEGMRVSGAREKANKENVKTSIDLTKIKPRQPKQLELPAEGTTRIEDREAFAKASAIGMTVDQYKRYQALIEKRATEDAEAAQARTIADQRKRQTAEWKANRAEMRPQVREEVRARAEVELDEMLADGRVKLSPEGLTDEQLAALPKEYIGADGIHPDDLAGLFGDSSGGLVDRVATLAQARAASGMKPKAFLERMVDVETDRQMEARYGSLDKNILAEAKDQVISETQEDLLHEETLARATEAGLEYSIGKEELKAAIKGFFDRQLVKDVSSDVALADAGRAGRATEMALLKGDFAEAFRQKQRQYNAIVMANFAKKFEKEQGRAEKTFDKYQDRTQKSTDQEYTNWIRYVMDRVGKLDPRKAGDLAGLIEKSDSGIKTLNEFVDYKEHHDLREVPVADFLRDPNFKKDYSALTTADAHDLHDSVRALDKNGRDEMKYIREGEAFDLAELKTNLIESLQRFKEKAYDTEGDRAQSFAGVRHAIRSAIVAHLQVETVFNRLDRYDSKGPWNQFVFRPLAEAANHEAKLEREFSRRLGAIADNVNLKEVIPNNTFMNPFNKTEPMRMTRKNLRAVLLNAGNESNFTKLAAGYLKQLDPEIEPGGNSLGAFKGEVRAWLDQHTTKEDMDWAQKVWDMLKELGERSDTMYRGLTGVAPEKIRIEPIQTPHGTYDGGYYPLIRHELYGEDIKLSKNDLEGAGYIRATTAAGYTKKRTGAIYPLSMDLDGLPNAIRQIIHDTAYRPAIIQAGKIFYDNKIKNEFKKHLGAEYADMFVPWLKDVANTQNYYSSKLVREFTQLSDFMRQNAITTLVGFNPGTVMKHTPTAIASSMAEVGPAAFLKAAQSLLTINEETGDRNWSFAIKNSEELQRRSRNWVETMGGGMRQLEGRTVRKALAQHEYGAAAMNLRDIITEVSSKPVAMGDLVSAVPTWMAKYTAEMEEHGVHGDAIYAADKAVRQAHGSSAITSRSAVARSRALSWFTGFFTFFNDLFNRQVETIWRAGEALDLAKEGQKAEAMAQATKVSGRLFAYVVVPAMIEEMVTPLTTDKKESWGKIAAKSLAFTLSSSYVFVREVVNAMLNGRDPSVGLLSTSYKSLTDMGRDLESVKPKLGNVIKHATTLTGMLTGLTPAQLGRSAQFMTGGEKPKGPWGWMVGMRYGTLKNHSDTFEKWMKGH